MFYTNIYFYLLAAILMFLLAIFAHDAYSDKVINRHEGAVMTQNCLAFISLVLLTSMFFVFGWKAGLLMLGISVITVLVFGLTAQKKRFAKILESQKRKK